MVLYNSPWAVLLLFGALVFATGGFLLQMGPESLDVLHDLTHAVRRLLDRFDLDEDDLRGYLYDPEMRDPDLLIRTANEMRVSNFLLWQISYSEFYVSDVLWPEFREEQLHTALRAYEARERRFGGRATSSLS